MIFVYISWVTVAVICAFLLAKYMRRRAHFSPLRKFPGTPPTFLIGNISWVISLYANAKQLKFHPGVYIVERILGGAYLYQETGMSCFWFGYQPLVAISKGEIAELVLGSSISIEKSYEYDFLHQWLGTGLLTSKGEKWKRRRKLLTPSFHFRILDDFIPVFNQQSLELVRKLKSQDEKEYIDIAPLIVLCTLDIICETVMGVSIGAQKGDNSEYVQAIHNLADFFNQRSVRPWLWSDFLFGLTKMGREFNRDIKITHGFTDKVIREKKEKLKSGPQTSIKDDASSNEYYAKQRKTFMDILLDMHMSGHQLSEADIREEVDTFMFEGHDTTAMAIIFALYCIGLYPEIQKNISKELDEIFDGNMERPITQDDTREMKYLECVLKESQRLYPSVPIIGRKLDEEIHYRQKFALLEEKIVICNILRHYNIVSLDPRDRFHIKVEFTLRPAQEVRLKFLPKG